MEVLRRIENAEGLEFSELTYAQKHYIFRAFLTTARIFGFLFFAQAYTSKKAGIR